MQIAARVSEEEKQELELYCKKHDITVAKLIRKAVKEYMANHNEES